MVCKCIVVVIVSIIVFRIIIDVIFIIICLVNASSICTLESSNCLA